MLYVGAIHRYYESRRRLFNDEQPSRREAARETKSKSRKTAFRKQVRVCAYTCMRVCVCVFACACISVKMNVKFHEVEVIESNKVLINTKKAVRKYIDGSKFFLARNY